VQDGSGSAWVECICFAIVSGKWYLLNPVRLQIHKCKALICAYCLRVKLILYSAVFHGTITYKMMCTTFVPSGFLRFENGGKDLKEFSGIICRTLEFVLFVLFHCCVDQALELVDRCWVSWEFGLSVLKLQPAACHCHDRPCTVGGVTVWFSDIHRYILYCNNSVVLNSCCKISCVWQITFGY
jgi:hypothetical protein